MCKFSLNFDRCDCVRCHAMSDSEEDPYGGEGGDAGQLLTLEELQRRARERDRKRDYLARRRKQEEELQRRAASAGAASSVPEPDAKRQKTSAAGSAAPRRRGRAAPAAPE